MLHLLGLLAVLGASPATAAWRLDVAPQDSAEAALRTALARREGEGRREALDSVSAAHPGTAASGLAQLASGLALLESRRFGEAIAHLGHPDVPLTPLLDRALLARGEAHWGLSQLDAAGRAFLAAATDPAGATTCAALPRAADAFTRAGQADEALEALARTVAACPREAPEAIASAGEIELRRGRRAAAAIAFDRLDHDYPASAAARKARPHLWALAALLPPVSPAEAATRSLRQGRLLLAAGRAGEAIEALRRVPLTALSPDEADLARVSLGRALLARGRRAEARATLGKVRADSTHAAEASFHLARDHARRTGSPEAYRAVADRFRGTPWGEDALLALANHYQKDALDQAALPWWRRLLDEYPDGRVAERAAWRVGWADYRARRHEAAAQTFERTARLRAPSAATPGFLYWAGRAREAVGQRDRARQLLEETVRRYKHTYHGLRAREALSRLGGAPTPAPPAFLPAGPVAEAPLPEPQGARVRQLLLIDRLAEAAEELRAMPDLPLAQGTLAWVEWRRGRYRPAIIAMKQARPDWIGEGGDRLPDEVWRILFPLQYEAQLKQRAERERVDPDLVAALILQESSFDPQARSRAGARGLMQVIPTTGRRLARALGVRYRRAALHDPETSLDFGTRYLRQMSDLFDGRVERVLAAYNAGPHRVSAWEAVRPGLPAEEFTEAIPLSETRGYVMIVLASREHYRRLYGLGRRAPGPVQEGARP